MKKLIAGISFVLYFAATSGIVINSHYCMKKLASVSLFGVKPDVCGRCGMDMHDNNGCCRDEVSVAKLVQDQVKMPVTIFELPSIEQTAVIVSDFMVVPVSVTEESRHFHNHSPPLLSAQDIYLQNNVFRI
ncbi:MAG TPA: hypothetical protein VMZ03_04610 [Chitinophagaceae bacterium]|nr:hypothetical protein [Chitinophagaceae bacterium]